MWLFEVSIAKITRVGCIYPKYQSDFIRIEHEITRAFKVELDQYKSPVYMYVQVYLVHLVPRNIL